MFEREWKLGVDLSTYDSLLGGLTFDDLILTVHHNCPKITRAAVYAELADILSGRKQDMMYLIENNIEEIMAEARKGRDDS